jgi:hypothetical protein
MQCAGVVGGYGHDGCALGAFDFGQGEDEQGDGDGDDAVAERNDAIDGCFSFACRLRTRPFPLAHACRICAAPD